MKTENFSEMHRKNMEAAMHLAQISVNNSQKLMALQSELARELFQLSVENARALTEAKDPAEVMRLRSQLAQTTTEKMIDYAQRMAELGHEARSEFSRLLTEQLAAGSHDMLESFQGLIKSLPGPNQALLESVQQAMATANSAFEQIARASGEIFSAMIDSGRGSHGRGK